MIILRLKELEMPSLPITAGRLRHWLALGTLSALLSGCGGAPPGPTLYPVKGKVTLEGSPLPNATVTFQPESGPIASGVTDVNGEFTLKTGAAEGAVAGTHRIAVVATTGEKITGNPTPDDLAAMSLTGKPLPQPKSLIPERYSKFETSQLTATVTEDAAQNVVTLDLKKQ
jgi:hypothetical protein